ncbi:MAG: UDP-4-amino-4,6-dideoxy-N-acetyl-beta-L-altrosamine transaminase [Bacteroidetes bacterium RIFCSPLOWO2_02_FULL_36_8]|nr:MAG: UDP-4-amino-4,6-dideoxy-N-acetyl-beta-L-altrosamine transaminase [Bacteroidetes bacterium RIFCSPLOWO2_02_FULL_36_8]OFY71016.1 MAG: UDP-4-amino-4,6-dideoxy-N-acetyl-beta-L-altrosamine transaminase [Bacteroidetes bacterium RIFCSPLOWO2_12_FULL_37_12]
MKPIYYGRQEITEEDIQSVVEVLKSDFLTQGPKIKVFEEKFANYIGCNYAVAVANGTAALHLTCIALGVNKDTRVITTPITFAASANCVRYCGGQVYFADIDKDSYLLDINKVEKLLKQHPKGFFHGIVVVDFAGYPVNLEAFKKLADEYGLWIIEDACHSPGGYRVDNKGKKQSCGNGNYADVAVFSFHPVKHIATGEGGMITTNNKILYEKLLLLRTHGITKEPHLLKENHGGWYYEMQELGYNYRLTDIQSALGISQLKKADERLKKRQEIAKRYDKAFKNMKIKIPQVIKNFSHAYHLYVIQVKDRLGLYNYLKQHTIFAQVHYIPVHLFPYYKQLGWKKGDLPVAEQFYEKCLSLPMYPSLKYEEQQYVIKTIKNFNK